MVPLRPSGALLLCLLPLAGAFLAPALPPRVAPMRPLCPVGAPARPSLATTRPSLALGATREPAGEEREKVPAPDGGWAPPAHKRKITNPLSELVVGQKLKGKVRNVEQFGAFVDIGAERDGFVHVKDISHDFVHSAVDLLRSGKEVDCYVKYVVPPEEGVTGSKNAKLGLTLLKEAADSVGLPIDRFSEIVGETVEGRILRVTNFGAFLDIGCEVDAFMHCSQLPMRRHHSTRMSLDELIVGRMMKVRILAVDEDARRVSVTGRAKGEKGPEERQRFSVPDRPEDVFRRPG